jgi:transcriptional regulator with XRE-family HTH domain
MTVGDRVKLRRQQLHLSAEDIAKVIGKDRSTVYRYESHDIEDLPVSIIKPLAEALKTSPAYLMGWESNSETIDMSLTSHEKEVVTAYRNKPDMQPAVDKLLGIEEDADLIPSLVAARSKSNDVPIHTDNLPDLSKFPIDDSDL